MACISIVLAGLGILIIVLSPPLRSLHVATVIHSTRSVPIHLPNYSGRAMRQTTAGIHVWLLSKADWRSLALQYYLAY